MIEEELQRGIQDAILATAHVGQQSLRWEAIRGGSISHAWSLAGEGVRWFVKTHSADFLQMFEAEADGLAALAAADCVRVPRPCCHGVVGTHAFLVLEWLDLGPRTDAAAKILGTQLANQHRHTAKWHGWHRDNTIGSTPQRNTALPDWIEFFRDRRLAFQLDLAARNGCNGNLQRLGGRLLNQLQAFFRSYKPKPSLLHGDLWGGNWAVDQGGQPVIYDPAVYYGDRESDIAMTELFGGFPESFYAAYRDTWPLDEGYRLRRDLYNVYHVLNHLNLFGGGYANQARDLMLRLLSEVR